MKFDQDVLRIDAAAVTDELIENIRDDVRRTLRRQGAVVGISGGIDSSVVLALCVQALGADRVVGIMMPERESSRDSVELARSVADRFGVDPILADVTDALEGLGCYRWRDEAIRRVFPEYGDGYLAKITLPGNVLDSDTLNMFHLTITLPDGTERSKRLDLNEFLQIVAASNFKQRARMATLYFYAEQRNYAVAGTPNKNEHDQGFFVKFGDGGYDLAPIAHLYKTQVFQLAEYLDVPERIRRAIPTTDTYSATVSQEEFFFRMPFDVMDLIWFAAENDVAVSDVARVMDLTPEQVERAFADLERKRKATQYLRQSPIRYG